MAESCLERPQGAAAAAAAAAAVLVRPARACASSSSPVATPKRAERSSEAQGKSSNASEMGDAGLVFVPPRCAAGARCALHVFLHGCQNPFFMEWPEARSLSVGRWAQTNDIVVLFPHMNGFACWDGYGTTGSDYNLRTGVQMTAIKQMIESVSGVQM